MENYKVYGELRLQGKYLNEEVCLCKFESNGINNYGTDEWIITVNDKKIYSDNTFTEILKKTNDTDSDLYIHVNDCKFFIDKVSFYQEVISILMRDFKGTDKEGAVTILYNFFDNFYQEEIYEKYSEIATLDDLFEFDQEIHTGAFSLNPEDWASYLIEHFMICDPNLYNKIMELNPGDKI